MPRALIAAILIVVAPHAVLAGEAAPADDLSKLQGAWTTLAGPNRDVPVTLEIEDDRVTVCLRPKGLPIRARGRLRVDAAAQPKALDWFGFTGLDGQELPEILAIYDLDGDTLKLCNGGPDNPRPVAFAPGEGALADVLVFRRAPAKQGVASSRATR